MTVQIAPSILAADFARLADEAAAVADVADWLHVDVMDGHFVPNLTLGLPVVEALLKHAGLPLDCHLMSEDPDRWAPGYAEAGARNVTIHVEAAGAPVKTVLPKLRRARALIDGRGTAIWLQVDGGVSEETIGRCAEAGADVFVAGSAVYQADDPAAAVQSLRALAEHASAGGQA